MSRILRMNRRHGHFRHESIDHRSVSKSNEVLCFPNRKEHATVKFRLCAGHQPQIEAPHEAISFRSRYSGWASLAHFLPDWQTPQTLDAANRLTGTTTTESCPRARDRTGPRHFSAPEPRSNELGSTRREMGKAESIIVRGHMTADPWKMWIPTGCSSGMGMAL